MEKHLLSQYSTSTFKPSEVEAITGVSTALLRDWRRRKIVHESLDKGPDGFALGSVCELLLLRLLSEHGIGPKTVYGWTSGLAANIAVFSIDDPAAWASPDEHLAWQRDKKPRRPERFAILTGNHPVVRTDDPADLMRSWGEAVGTVIDLESLGATVRQKASKPLIWLAGYLEIIVKDGDLAASIVEQEIAAAIAQLGEDETGELVD